MDHQCHLIPFFFVCFFFKLLKCYFSSPLSLSLSFSLFLDTWLPLHLLSSIIPFASSHPPIFPSFLCLRKRRTVAREDTRAHKRETTKGPNFSLSYISSHTVDCRDVRALSVVGVPKNNSGKKQKERTGVKTKTNLNHFCIPFSLSLSFLFLFVCLFFVMYPFYSFFSSSLFFSLFFLRRVAPLFFFFDS